MKRAKKLGQLMICQTDLVLAEMDLCAVMMMIFVFPSMERYAIVLCDNDTKFLKGGCRAVVLQCKICR